MLYSCSIFETISFLSITMNRLYFMGEVGAVDILRPDAAGGESDGTVLLNGIGDGIGENSEDYKSGFHEILVGGSTAGRDMWSKGSSEADVQVLEY